ncbi:hypothetical protein JCM33374_g4728 [Metschnikowia sp. JCM 33374]|nr:hypothetical protein JCM33374_g4728 [Metschnikowia sp. JCM 33374]
MTVPTVEYPTHNEFRSDTFTVPTAAMKQAVANGLVDGSLSLGDSVYKEDPLTLQLESKMAQLTGKAAALFCVSGTLSNQIALRAHLLQPPYSVLCDHRAHVFLHEAGGLAALSQAMVHPVVPANGNYLTVEDIEDNYTPCDGDIHGAPTKVISLENTLHGILTPLEEIKKISEFAKNNHVRLHLDGARLFNASVETKVSLREYCSYFDSVSLCLSKSVGAPMGSVLVGETALINTANHFKKQCGGGVRQVGMMSLMAMIAIDENVGKIHQSHAYAKEVAAFCAQHHIAVESPADTNFIFLDMKKNRMSDESLVKCGEKHHVRLMGKRIAFHFQNSPAAVENLKKALLECKQEAERNPYMGRSSAKKMYNVEVVKRNQEKATAS